MVAIGTTELPAVEDLTGTCWRDDLWLQTYGLLSHLTVLDYFALSPFFDKTSNNEVARQRGLRLEQLPQGAPGIEFILQDAQPPHLFVVRKQFRSLAGELTPLAFYYILDGTVYQAPSLYAALSSRMERCLWTVKSAFGVLRSDLDTLGERGNEAMGGELAAEVKRKEAAKEAVLEMDVETQRKVERAVLATLLDHPLPTSAAALNIIEKGRGGGRGAAAVPKLGSVVVEGETGGGTATAVSREAGGVAVSFGAVSRRG